MCCVRKICCQSRHARSQRPSVVFYCFFVVWLEHCRQRWIIPFLFQDLSVLHLLHQSWVAAWLFDASRYPSYQLSIYGSSKRIRGQVAEIEVETLGLSKCLPGCRFLWNRRTSLVYNLFICCEKVSVEFHSKPVLSHLTKNPSVRVCGYLHFQQGIITSLPTPDPFFYFAPHNN